MTLCSTITIIYFQIFFYHPNKNCAQYLLSISSPPQIYCLSLYMSLCEIFAKENHTVFFFLFSLIHWALLLHPCHSMCQDIFQWKTLWLSNIAFPFIQWWIPVLFISSAAVFNSAMNSHLQEFIWDSDFNSFLKAAFLYLLKKIFTDLSLVYLFSVLLEISLGVDSRVTWLFCI